MPVCIKDLWQSSTSIAWVSVLEEMSYASTRYFISSNKHTKDCAGFWVKGFKVKVDQDKSTLYLKRASSLVLTISWPQEAREMIVGLSGHAGPWPRAADFPTLHPRLKAGQLAMFSRESEGWICMYNLLVLMLASNFVSPPPKKKKNSGNKIYPMMCWNQPSVSAGFLFLA